MPPGVSNQPPRRRDLPVEHPPRSGFASFLDDHRAGIGSLIVALAAVGIGWAAWARLGGRVGGSADLVLHPEAIEVRGVAPWVRADLKGEALRDASLDGGLPLDDPELVRRLARAFAMHPWVRDVEFVKVQHPASAEVAIRCREPAAMVVVPGGLLAVDSEGVVLPSDDFTAESAAAYPRITGVPSSPQGAVGFAWGDPLVEEAAAVAAAIGPDWKRLVLTGCRPAAAQTEGGRVWELFDDAGRTIRFGSAPGHERKAEPTAAMKLARLRSLAEGVSADLTSQAADRQE